MRAVSVWPYGVSMLHMYDIQHHAHLLFCFFRPQLNSSSSRATVRRCASLRSSTMRCSQRRLSTITVATTSRSALLAERCSALQCCRSRTLATPTFCDPSRSKPLNSFVLGADVFAAEKKFVGCLLTASRTLRSPLMRYVRRIRAAWNYMCAYGGQPPDSAAARRWPARTRVLHLYTRFNALKVLIVPGPGRLCELATLPPKQHRDPRNRVRGTVSTHWHYSL